MDTYFQTIHKNETYLKKFKTYGQETVFKFKSPPKNVPEIEWLKSGFYCIVENMKSHASDTDYLGFTLTSLSLKLPEPGYMTFRPASQVNGDVLWTIFGGIVQSNAESIKSTDTFQVKCTIVKLPVGSGRRRQGYFNSFEEECRKRRGIITISNTDNLCLPRALVVGALHASKDPIYKQVSKNVKNSQKIRAVKLCEDVGLTISPNGAGIPELRKFQSFLKDYQITVYNYNTKGREVYFKGDVTDARYKINLLFNEGHYNVITSLTSAFSCSYYCEACNQPFDHKILEHKCMSTCKACLAVSPPCTMQGNGIVCYDCNRLFKNQVCLVSHKGEVCKSLKQCKDCGKLINLRNRRTPHQCGEIYCKTCGSFKQENHMCHMQVDRKEPPKKDFLFIFFDLETRQDEKLNQESETKVHKVNLCVSRQYCWECIGTLSSEQTCSACAWRTRIFKTKPDHPEDDPIDKFMVYVMDIRKQFKRVCLLAHNGQGFDYQFIIKYLMEKTKFEPKVIMRGTKIILLEIDNVRFVDSLSYFPMALSKLPKAFDLPPEKKKGYFPHLFNTVANHDYVGPMPSEEYYCPDNMFEDARNKFKSWYDSQVSSDYVFDFQKELVEYCISDVDILAQACIKFRKIFIDECNVDPFLEATTIASACNLAFRRNFLKQDTIGLIPKNGYRLTDVQSAIALQWMTWEEQKRNVRIEHAGRGREVKIGGMKVDGYDGKRVYEFQGCYYHGCPRCFPHNRYDPLRDDPSDTLALRYERTRMKTDKLKSTGYDLIEIWECEFRAAKKLHNLSYLDTLPVLNTLPLVPRDAFYGGRTGNAKTYHRCTEDETIQYVDVCSLYPYVCKYGRFPVGHPKIHTGDRDCRNVWKDVEGLVKCKVLPPLRLYHPVLPTRMNEKLMFVLCRTCGETMNQGECEHTSDERALVGTWTTDEIRKAEEKGYVILDMFELWEYEMATYENGGLFTEFINKFLKMKQEASGYPSWCKTEEDKDRYIRDFHEREGILLDKSKIEKNEGLRSLAKLMLNSFWGKFGQRENQNKTVITKDPKVFFDLLTSPSVQVNNIHEVSEDALIVNWEYIDEAGELLRNVNVVIAAYTTAQARLKLYEHLEALEKQVLYYDTDSVLYTHKEGQYSVPTGDFLGEMTDELEKDYGVGSYITEFVSGGPKTYAYLVKSVKHNNDIKAVCKVKGLTLNFETSKTINFSKLKELILDENESTVEIKEQRISRTKEKDVVTVTRIKNFKITGPKRKRNGRYDTLPFGFQT